MTDIQKLTRVIIVIFVLVVIAIGVSRTMHTSQKSADTYADCVAAGLDNC